MAFEVVCLECGARREIALLAPWRCPAGLGHAVRVIELKENEAKKGELSLLIR